MRRVAAASFLIAVAACSRDSETSAERDSGAVLDGSANDALVGGDASPVGDDASSNDAASASGGRGFPAIGPWVSFYGSSAGVDLAKVASTFRIVNVDVDPTSGNFTDADI